MTQICKKHTNKSLMKMSENTKFSQTGQGGILFSYLLTHVNFNILQLLGSFFIFFAEIQLWVFVRLQAKCRTSVSCYCQCYKCQYINKMFAEVLKALLYKPNNSLKIWNTSNLNKSVHINITWSISNYSKSAAVFL